MTGQPGEIGPGDGLAQRAAAGVSIWLDGLSRRQLRSGSLAELIRHRHVSGVTPSLPSVRAEITTGSDYDEQIAECAAQGLDAQQTVLAMITDDVRAACDLLAPVVQATGGVDGWVSIEVDPRLARDPAGTIAQARELARLVGRDNVLIAIPATLEGLTAISAVLAEGMSVNVTHIVAIDRYRAVMNAFVEGLERAHAAGQDVSGIHSVASFIVSPVDTAIDPLLDAVGTDEARALKGQAALANARLAHQAFEEVFSTPRWRSLADDGASPQRPLWASTAVTDPAYPDTSYVTELVAPGTITTTYAAAEALLDAIEAQGISYVEVVGVLEREGLATVEHDWEALLADVADALRSASTKTDPGSPPAG